MILIATGIFPPDIGGPATYSELLVKELPKRDWQVRVITYGPAGVSRNIPKGVRHLVYFFLCLWHGLRADVIFAQDSVSAGLPALVAAKILGKPFVIRVAGDYAWEQSTQRFGVRDGIDDFQNRRYGFRTELLRMIERAVTSRADLIITPSRYFRELVSGWVGDPSKVRRVYNGIPLEETVCPVGIRRESRTIASAGRLVPWKGFSELIELMAELPDWQLVIIGDGPERERLESLIEHLALGGRVRLTGALDQAEVIRKLCRSSMFVLNTSFESFSFQVVQAMHLGVPVIATKIGNLPEIIEDGREGILVEPNDKAAILEAIRKLSVEQRFRDTLTENAYRKAEEFSLSRMVGELEALFARLVS